MTSAMLKVGSVLVVAFALGCGGGELKGEGEECFGTAECASGLTCNAGENPRRCRMMQTPMPDADIGSPLPDAAPRPDADPNAPDADLTLPDAAVPDAAVPDAALPDATPPTDA